MCISYAAYKKINPSSQIIVDGTCMDGCTNSFNTTLTYAFNIYFTTENNSILSSNSVWTLFTATDGLATGNQKKIKNYK